MGLPKSLQLDSKTTNVRGTVFVEPDDCSNAAESSDESGTQSQETTMADNKEVGILEVGLEQS